MSSPSPLAGEGLPPRSGGGERARRKLLRNRAKQLRSGQTEAEHRVWQILRAKRFAGYKFKRQQPIDNYIVDFVCFSRRLIIEVDGGQHVGSTYDRTRDQYLADEGFRVLRIWNSDVFENEEGACEAILLALTAPLPNPSPAKGKRG